MRGMKRLAFAVVLAVTTPALATCPHDEAAALVKRADQLGHANLDAAIDTLVRASKIDPANAHVHYELARAYAKKEDWRNAARSAARAAELAPTFANHHWLRGLALEQQKRWAEAKAAFEAALAADPGYAIAHADLATTLEHLDDDAGALAHYTRAIRLAPSQISTYASLADLYRRLGFADQAVAVIREGLGRATRGEDRFWLDTLAGAIAEDRKANDEAIARYRDAAQACGACTGRASIATFNLGMALAAGKKANRAEAIEQLGGFMRRVCRGAAAAAYADECMQTSETLKRLGSP